jgi:hypothetical protein
LLRRDTTNSAAKIDIPFFATILHCLYPALLKTIAGSRTGLPAGEDFTDSSLKQKTV